MNIEIDYDLINASLHPGEGIRAWQTYLPKELVMLCKQQADMEEWD